MITYCPPGNDYRRKVNFLFAFDCVGRMRSMLPTLFDSGTMSTTP